MMVPFTCLATSLASFLSWNSTQPSTYFRFRLPPALTRLLRALWSAGQTSFGPSPRAHSEMSKPRLTFFHQIHPSDGPELLEQVLDLGGLHEGRHGAKIDLRSTATSVYGWRDDVRGWVTYHASAFDVLHVLLGLLLQSFLLIFIILRLIREVTVLRAAP
jgi:hypothetical protein